MALSDTFPLAPFLFGSAFVRWVDVSRWNERSAPNQRTTHKSQLEATRFKVPAALREKHPSLPVVVVSGLPFDKTEAEVM